MIIFEFEETAYIGSVARPPLTGELKQHQVKNKLHFCIAHLIK